MHAQGNRFTTVVVEHLSTVSSGVGAHWANGEAEDRRRLASDAAGDRGPHWLGAKCRQIHVRT